MSEEIDDYAYRFQYADGSAFVVLADGRAFITFPEKDGRTRPPEQKFGKIDNRIPLLIGRAAKPRQDRIEELERALALEKNLVAVKENQLARILMECPSA
jgi:hypothetical protein